MKKGKTIKRKTIDIDINLMAGKSNCNNIYRPRQIFKTGNALKYAKHKNKR